MISSDLPRAHVITSHTSSKISYSVTLTAILLLLIDGIFKLIQATSQMRRGR